MEHDQNLNKMAVQATLHCLTGCAMGEVSGLLIGTGLSLPSPATVTISIALAFAFGFGLTIRGLIKHGVKLKEAGKIALASDGLSITTMEIVDNLFMLLIPGAMSKGLTNPTFWISMALSLGVAYCCALPVNRWLLKRGKGHALVHQYHDHH